MPPLRALEPPKKLRKVLPKDMARGAIAHEESAPGVVLLRQAAEAFVARGIREEKNIGALVTEILEAAATKGRRRPGHLSFD